MTTYAEAASDIRSLFSDLWVDTLSYPVEWPNETSAATLPPVTQTPWGRMVVLHATGGQISLPAGKGQARYARGGVAIFQIFVASSLGTSQIYGLVKRITDLFDGKRGADGTYFRNTRIREIGTDGSWYQVNVYVDFDYEEVK